MGQQRRERTSKKLPDSRVRVVAGWEERLSVFLGRYLFRTDEGAIGGAEERHHGWASVDRFPTLALEVIRLY